MKNGMLVEAEIWTVAHTEQGNAVLVKPLGSELAVPIFIGQLEAHSILIGLGGVPMPRPLTHDLLASVIADLEGELEKIVVHDLRDHTFYAKLVIRRSGKVVEVDARPSDAIALGVAFDTPIYAEESVLQQVCNQSEP